MGGGTLGNRINGVWSLSVHRTAQEFSTILLENSPKFLTTNNVMLLGRKIFVVGEERGGVIVGRVGKYKIRSGNFVEICTNQMTPPLPLWWVKISPIAVNGYR